MPHPDLEYALSGDLLDDVNDASSGDLRDRRAVLSRVEEQMSYLRRVAQSRLDVTRSELAQRTAGRRRSELSDIIRRLPDVLSEQGISHSAPGVVAPDIDVDPRYCDDLDAVVSPVRLLDVGTFNRTELRELVVRLEAIEARVSVQRRLVQERLDQVEEEIARREDAIVGS